MKTLYLIGGTMGVGKTTVSQQLKKELTNSVFLDGDWCWDADPFQVTDETKAMVMDNICYLLNNFLHCSAYENVIFCWVMHEQSIVDEIVSKLDTEECRVIKISRSWMKQICGSGYYPTSQIRFVRKRLWTKALHEFRCIRYLIR